jgi:hypothetical protein
MSIGDAAKIIDLDAEPEPASGHDRGPAIALAFAMCLAVGSSAVGRDGPLATAPTDGAHVLALPPRILDAHLFTMPDRLANEPLSNLEFVVVRVRGTQGLGARVGSPGGVWLVTWTEGGTAYWLSSERRDLPDLVRLAASLR